MKVNFEEMLNKAIKDKNEVVKTLSPSHILCRQALNSVSREEFGKYVSLQVRNECDTMVSEEAQLKSGLSKGKYLLCIKYYNILGVEYRLGRDYLGHWR